MHRILLIGNGAREHAIGTAACRSRGVNFFAFMSRRNPGIARLCAAYGGSFKIGNPEDSIEVAEYAKQEKIDLAVVGPDPVLEAGVSDALWAAGIPCAGPVRAAARLEWDKTFARNLMAENKIEGLPKFGSFTDAKKAAKFIDELGGDVAVKPSGLTGGKGVKVTGVQLADGTDAKQYAKEVLDQNIGRLGSVVIEEKIVGQEFTLQAFVDGKNVVGMPAVQDHKLAYEGDTGPNTGGMGSYNDASLLLPFMRQSDYDQAIRIMKKTVAAMAKAGAAYKGFLYGQFIIGKEATPKVIEYNARFGDPEAMNVLALLRSDFVETMHAICDGSLSRSKADFEPKATVCKYLVPEGYPENPKKNELVKVDEASIARARAQLYYASVDEREGRVYTGTSRAIATLGVADTIEEAERIAERATHFVVGPVYHRRDIGTKELIQKRIDHMKQLRG